MVKKNNNQVIGKWAFIIGIILAVIAALATGALSGYAEIIMLVLFILGLIVGFLNIEKGNVVKFLVAIVALIAIGGSVLNALDIVQSVNIYLEAILSNFIAFVSAVGLVVAIKAILETSKK